MKKYKIDTPNKALVLFFSHLILVAIFTCLFSSILFGGLTMIMNAESITELTVADTFKEGTPIGDMNVMDFTGGFLLNLIEYIFYGMLFMLLINNMFGYRKHYFKLKEKA